MVTLVNEKILEGWRPQGGPFQTGYTDNCFGQAMLKVDRLDPHEKAR